MVHWYQGSWDHLSKDKKKDSRRQAEDSRRQAEDSRRQGEDSRGQGEDMGGQKVFTISQQPQHGQEYYTNR